jgi:Zn-dependent protease with chaperone function
MRALFSIGAVLALGACTAGYNTGGITPVAGQFSEDPDRARLIFEQVLVDIHPEIIRECGHKRVDGMCDFTILVDMNPRNPPNAFQSLADDGQPTLTFTVSMIASMSSSDEVAFVMAHEASHHILDHLNLQHRASEAAAEAFAKRAATDGASEEDILEAQLLGARVGALAYSKDYELQADRLGAIITYQAGYDPERGAQFFSRLPDPGDDFLATHPSNGTRRQAVADVVRKLER